MMRQGVSGPQMAWFSSIGKKPIASSNRRVSSYSGEWPDGPNVFTCSRATRPRDAELGLSEYAQRPGVSPPGRHYQS